MSKDHDTHDDTHGATTIRASKGGGGGGKLLLGVVAAAVLLGGGYFAYKNYAAPQDGAQTAFNDGYTTDPYDDPVRAGPVGSSDTDTSGDQLASTASESSAPSPARRAAPRREEAVPEATIGVTPASVSEEEFAAADSDDLVVTAPVRPIWARTPSERRLASYYPTRALERGREGEARLHCTVLQGGSLDCEKASETPGGFGNAALRVARSLRHANTRSDGTDAAGTPVNLRVVFRIDEDTRRG